MRLGSTCEEVEKESGIPHTTTSARRTELRANDYTKYAYITDADGKRRIMRRRTDSGKTAAVELATEKGKRAIRNGSAIVVRGDDPTRGYHGGNPMSEDAYHGVDRSEARRIVLGIMVKYTPEDE